MALKWVVLGYAAAAEAIMYQTRPSCYGDSCTPSDHLRHQKSIMKSQRNALLIASALTFYWILYSVTNPVVRIEQINQRDERLRNRV
ncbi:hypothetical protein Bca4012_045997 [Brassica carinata]